MKKIFIQITFVFSILSLFIVSGCANSTPVKNKYTVTFKDYDGTVLRTEKIEEGHNATAPNDPTRHGYIFTGWDQEYTNIQKDTIITAQYKRDESVLLEYKVIFKDYNGDILKEEIVEEWHNATAPSNPEREGYIFVGWDQEYTNIKNDLDVFAKYETIKYSIKYELNEGTLKKENPSEYSIEDSFELKKPLKDGFTFEGWYTNPEFTGSKVKSILKGTTGNIELYAKYNAIEYNITYKLDDGTNNSINPNEYTVLDEIILEAPTKEGYKFIGWELNGTIIQSIHKGTIGNLVLQAKWQINKYTITFNTDGGSNIDSITQDYNTKIVKPADPIKEGYTFVGWDKEIPTTMPAENITIKALWGIGEYFIKFDTDGGTRINTIVQDYNTEIVKPADPTKEGYTFVGWDQEIPTTMPAENLTIKAIWQVNTYTITFDTDGGNVINCLEFTIETQNLMLPTPIKEGYEFKGWYENDVLVETVELKDYSLLAKWEEIQSLEFELSSDETYYIVAGIGNVTDTDIVIPSTYKNLPVKEIKADAFMENNEITSVEIPNSVITIGNGAFYKCSSINKMIIPFVGKTLDGTGYTYLGYIFGAPVAEYSNSYVPTSLKEVQVTGSTILGISAFEGCKSLTTITIPDTVTLIRSNAFKGCTSLTSLDIPNSVTSIESSAFSSCTSLTSMEIPNSVSTIGQRIFSGCTSLEKIIIPFVGETIDGTKNTHLGYIFGKENYLDNKYVPTNLKEVVITNATSIKISSFKDCTSLESIVIPNTVTSIGSSAFEWCTSLTSIEIPNSVTSIGQGAFSRCTSLKSIEIPENITIIEPITFYNCTSLTSIKIPNNVTRIGYDAFTYCESLNNIEIPDSVTTIESGAFDGCTSLESIKISNNVEMIGQGAFRSCNSLTIYCEAEFKPNGWNDDWNPSNCPVIWGFKIYEENGYTYVNLGRYPQTVVTDKTTISALSSISTTNNLGYIEYNGNEYKVVTASPIDSNYTFINGNIIEYTTYYFLVEPIKWIVLEENNGTYELLSEMILDKHLFYKSYDDREINGQTIYANNYEYSDIRAWLNGYDGTSYNVDNYNNNSFINIAFTSEEQHIINNTLVDNSLQTTADSSNKYVCNNTEDKVYLLSRYDVLMNYGVLGTAYLSDYVRSKRCVMDTTIENFGRGNWWVRTPDDGSRFNSCCIHVTSSINHYPNVNVDVYGVRPAMTITLK